MEMDITEKLNQILKQQEEIITWLKKVEPKIPADVINHVEAPRITPAFSSFTKEVNVRKITPAPAQPSTSKGIQHLRKITPGTALPTTTCRKGIINVQNITPGLLPDFFLSCCRSNVAGV